MMCRFAKEKLTRVKQKSFENPEAQEQLVQNEQQVDTFCNCLVLPSKNVHVCIVNFVKIQLRKLLHFSVLISVSSVDTHVG